MKARAIPTLSASVQRTVLIAVAYVFASLVSWHAVATHWVTALSAGPLAHLSMAVAKSRDSREYMDGVCRITVDDVVIRMLGLGIWTVGFVSVLSFFRRRPVNSRMPWRMVFWLLTGAANVCIHALRSV